MSIEAWVAIIGLIITGGGAVWWASAINAKLENMNKSLETLVGQFASIVDTVTDHAVRIRVLEEKTKERK